MQSKKLVRRRTFRGISNQMKLIQNTYKHTKEGFSLKVTTCNKKLATN